MYHVIAAPPPTQYAYLYVTPNRFRKEMQGLQAAGFCAVTLQSAYAIWTGAAAPPAGCTPLVLRFDDGYTSAFTSAFPLLEQMGWPGSLCQQVQRVNIPGGLPSTAIQTMLGAGWELLDHGYYNPELSLIGASPAQISTQVITSRADLETEFHTTVDFYCWPLGYYDTGAITVVKQAGFEGALGVTSGDADPAIQGWWRLDSIPAWGYLSSASLVARVVAMQKSMPTIPPRNYVPT